MRETILSIFIKSSIPFSFKKEKKSPIPSSIVFPSLNLELSGGPLIFHVHSYLCFYQLYIFTLDLKLSGGPYITRRIVLLAFSKSIMRWLSSLLGINRVPSSWLVDLFSMMCLQLKINKRRVLNIHVSLIL